jgi:beta-1,4-mannosyltransferase
MPTGPGTRKPSRMIVGSWPGRDGGQNRFQQILLDALEAEGVGVEGFAASRDIRLEGLDVLIVHWPERIFQEARNAAEALRLMTGFLRKLQARPPSLKVVWVVHNLHPHFSRGFKRLSWPWYADRLARVVDGGLTLSKGTVDTVRAAFPGMTGKPLGYFWHPFYPGEGISPDLRVVERAALGWSEAGTVYGFCGQIRPGKGVEDLVAAFRSLPDPAARLLVAGLPVYEHGLAEALTRLAADDPRICLRLQDLTEEEFRANLSVCDIVVAPFRRYLHSGSLVHALSCHRPVLTPATPFSTSLADHLASPGWVQTYEGPLTPAVLARGRYPEAPLDLAPLAPAEAARRIVRFLEGLPDRRKGATAAPSIAAARCM